jgi:hypothetical protein
VQSDKLQLLVHLIVCSTLFGIISLNDTMLSFYTTSSLSAPALVRICLVALLMITNMGTATSDTGYGHHGALRVDRGHRGSSATNVATPVKTILFDKDPQAVAGSLMELLIETDTEDHHGLTEPIAKTSLPDAAAVDSNKVRTWRDRSQTTGQACGNFLVD